MAAVLAPTNATATHRMTVAPRYPAGRQAGPGKGEGHGEDRQLELDHLEQDGDFLQHTGIVPPPFAVGDPDPQLIGEPPGIGPGRLFQRCRAEVVGRHRRTDDRAGIMGGEHVLEVGAVEGGFPDRQDQGSPLLEHHIGRRGGSG